MGWLERVTSRLRSKRGPSAITVQELSPTEVSERERKRQAQIAESRAKAFAGIDPVPLAEVAPLRLEEDLVYAGVDFMDRLVMAVTPADRADSWAGRDISPGLASFPHSKSAEAYPLQVRAVLPDGSTTEATLPAVPVAFPTVQPMPDGNWLVVGARSRYTDSGPEHNAYLYSAVGKQLTSFCIGDGVNSVQVTPSGQIWASYHDEGVFGNYGWGAPDGPEPLGRSGLVRWSPSGERTLELIPPEGCGLIADCYALNVTGEDAWVCYYTDFPIVHTRSDGSVVGWLTEANGPHALAIDEGDRVGLLGGYQGLFDRLVLVDISADDVAPTLATYRLATPGLAELPADTRLFARGRHIHAITDSRWLRLDIRQLPHTDR